MYTIFWFSQRFCKMCSGNSDAVALHNPDITQLQFGRSTYVVSDDSSERSFPPSPPTIIDYLNHEDYEASQQTWSDPDQNILYSVHRRPILKPKAVKFPANSSMFLGRMVNKGELPRLKVVLPESGLLAGSNSKGTYGHLEVAASSFKVITKEAPACHRTINTHTDRSRYNGCLLGSSNTGRRTWTQPSHNDFNNWIPCTHLQNGGSPTSTIHNCDRLQSPVQGRKIVCGMLNCSCLARKIAFLFSNFGKAKSIWCCPKVGYNFMLRKGIV